MQRPDPVDYIWWLTSRAAGVVAIVLCAAAVIAGLLMATKLVRRPGLPRVLMAVHEQAAIAGLVAIGVHTVALLGDGYLRPSPLDLVVPFALGHATFFTGLGVIAAWLALLLGVSFYFRRHIGAKLWRKAHRATAAVYVLGMVHAIGAGTDGGSTPMLVLAALTGVPILALLAVRYGRRPVSAASKTTSSSTSSSPSGSQTGRSARTRPGLPSTSTAAARSPSASS